MGVPVEMLQDSPPVIKYPLKEGLFFLEEICGKGSHHLKCIFFTFLLKSSTKKSKELDP